MIPFAALLLQEVPQYYFELDPDAVVKQPWNAYSSLFFFIPVVYWLWKLRGQYKTYSLLLSILPLAFLNGLGSTLWHANNGGSLFGLLDVLPPLVMLIVLCLYFWRIVLGKWIWGVLTLVGFLALNVFTLVIANNAGAGNNIVNIYYLLNGLMIAAPTIAVLYKTRWIGWYQVLGAIAFMGAALLFRSFDKPETYPYADILPQGTHFLWHIFSVCAMFPLGYYLMRLQNYRTQQAQFA